MTKAEAEKARRVQARLRDRFPQEAGYRVDVFNVPGYLGLNSWHEGTYWLTSWYVPLRYNVFAAVKLFAAQMEKAEQAEANGAVRRVRLPFPVKEQEK